MGTGPEEMKVPSDKVAHQTQMHTHRDTHIKVIRNEVSWPTKVAHSPISWERYKKSHQLSLWNERANSSTNLCLVLPSGSWEKV